MNIRRRLVALLLCPVALPLAAQGLQSTYKPSANGNPLSPCVYCADPTAVEHDGRLYVYGTNDHQQFLANGRKGDNNYGDIRSLVVFSTDDMANWTFHGTIDVGSLCGSWCHASWAPSVVSKTGDDGVTRFYLYFSNSGGGVGVLMATSPTGPWRSPLGKQLVGRNTPGVGLCNAPFDPGVAFDADGTAWLAFGGGSVNAEGTALMPGNARIVKLRSNMIALDGAAVEIPAPYHFEANELNLINGKLVYTYCSSWTDRNDWPSYGRSLAAPTAASMCYMVSATPLEPSSWNYKGQYLANPGTFGYPYGNNHTHLHKFGPTYYLFYHTQDVERRSASGASGFRSIAVNRASVYERTQTIQAVTADDKGPTAIKRLDPYTWQQAETMATAGGVSYEHFTNVQPAPAEAKSSLGNDASTNLQIAMSPGSWTMVRNADFGDDGARTFVLRASGSGVLEVRVGNLAAAPVARLEFAADEPADISTDTLDSPYLKGVRSVYFVFTEARDVQFDAWRFTSASADGIRPPMLGAARGRAYDLTGRPVQRWQGIYIMDGKKCAGGGEVGACNPLSVK